MRPFFLLPAVNMNFTGGAQHENQGRILGRTESKTGLRDTEDP